MYNAHLRTSCRNALLSISQVVQTSAADIFMYKQADGNYKAVAYTASSDPSKKSDNVDSSSSDDDSSSSAAIIVVVIVAIL